MRKALIVGELNPVLMNINQCLINEFETQMCEADLETIKKMRKLLQPDLLVISQQGIDGKEDVLILDMLKEKMPKMPIVFIETVTAKNHLSEYERVFPNFVLLKRPIVKKMVSTITISVFFLFKPIRKNLFLKDIFEEVGLRLLIEEEYER